MRVAGPIGASEPAVGDAAGGTVHDRLFRLAGVYLMIAAAAIGSALAFQHLGGFQPCALCLMQRTPYYIEIPLAGAAAAAIWWRAPVRIIALIFAALALLALYNAGLGVYHAGVEWRFWEGPASCAPSIGVGSAADMMNQLRTTHAPSCTDAVWRFAGLSFAGWSAVISLGLAVLAMLGLRLSWRSAGP